MYRGLSSPAAGCPGSRATRRGARPRAWPRGRAPQGGHGLASGRDVEAEVADAAIPGLRNGSARSRAASRARPAGGPGRRCGSCRGSDPAGDAPASAPSGSSRVIPTISGDAGGREVGRARCTPSSRAVVGHRGHGARGAEAVGGLRPSSRCGRPRARPHRLEARRTGVACWRRPSKRRDERAASPSWPEAGTTRLIRTGRPASSAARAIMTAGAGPWNSSW